MFERLLDVPFEPIQAVKRVGGLPGLAFLYSGLADYGLGRYSILAVQPTKEISLAGASSDCFEEFRKAYPEFGKAPRGTLPFYGGCLGYFSYEAGMRLEYSQFPDIKPNDVCARFGFYEGGIVFDHLRCNTWLVSLRDRPSNALQDIASMAFEGASVEIEPFELRSHLESNFEKAEYLECVEAIRRKIRQGEVYQVNLSQRFEGNYSGSGVDLFCRLAGDNPAPYSAYLNFGDEEIVSSSPERFLLVEGQNATTRPIKGTRSRGATKIETERSELDLKASEKDRSELLMIVDLERNDLGRVCLPGSVVVDRLFQLERYATVIHQTADVSGVLEDSVDAIECAKAMFPGGSITGAPKIRAMQVIDELERGQRGVYTGSIGYFDVSGRADLNIAIRTLRLAEGRVSFQVGGGIVWDSDPESEYEETLLKAKAMVAALKGEKDAEIVS